MKKLPGFTLIELLIVASMIAVLSGVSIVGYARFQDKQRVVAAAEQLGSDLRLAQQKALSGKKPDACTGDLVSWRVETIAASQTYTMSAICPNSVSDPDRSFPAGTSVTTTETVDFSVLTGAAASGDATITVTGTFAGTTYTKTVTVTSAGGISVLP